MTRHATRAAAVEIAQALGLPLEGLVGYTLTARALSPVLVEARYTLLNERTQVLVHELRRFELQEAPDHRKFLPIADSEGGEI